MDLAKNPGRGEHLSDRKDLAVIVQTQEQNPDLFQQFRDAIKHRVVAIALRSTDHRASLRAAQIALNRTDPEPRPPVLNVLATGPVSFSWDQSVTSSSPIDPAPSRPPITTDSSGNGHGSASSSSTDDLADL